MENNFSGPLFFDESKKLPLEELVKAAVDLHERRFPGRKITACFVHPGALTLDQAGNEDLRVNEVPVKARRFMLPHHAWAGS